MKKILTLVLSMFLFAACHQSGPKSENKTGSSPTDVAAVRTIELHVTGMTCEGCENTVMDAVNGLEGVTASKASFTEELTKVSYDTTRTSLAEITKTIDDLGYKVEGVMNDSKTEK